MGYKRRLTQALEIVSLALLASGCERCNRSAAPLPSPKTSLSSSAVTKRPPELDRAIEALRRGGKTEVLYAEPSQPELDGFRTWLATFERSAREGGSLPGATLDGFRVTDLGDLWLLHEEQERRRGAGAVLLRKGPASAVVVEAPHTFFDVGTLSIALAAFETGRARALLFNTVHRYRSREPEANADGEEDPTTPIASDVAHAPRSFFLTAHELFTANAQVAVQFHGFRDDAVDADVVLSAAGTSAPASRVKAGILRAQSDLRVVLFPDETKKLGAMTNVEAAASRRGASPFLHVEMNRKLRTLLEGSEEARLTFTRSITEALVETPPPGVRRPPDGR